MGKRSFIAIVGSVLIMTACQNQDGLEQQYLSLSSGLDLENTTGIQHDIMVNILANHYGGYHQGKAITRATDDFDLIPYEVNGDTAMYIAQYSDGWEIYSADKSSQMLLYSSDRGQFDLDDPEMPDQLHTLISQQAKALAARVANKEMTEIDSSWGGISLSDDVLDKGVISVLQPSGDYGVILNTKYPPGHWMLVDAEKIDEDIYTSPKLVETLWSQYSTWNQYCPEVYYPKKGWGNAPAGCSPVAAGQYMYYTHFKDGIPEKAYSMIYENSANNQVAFAGLTSNVWDLMAKRKTNSGTSYVAILLRYLGREMETEYRAGGSSTYESKFKAFLNKTYGKTFVKTNFSSTSVIASIDNGYPVLANARTNKKLDGSSLEREAGHDFIIDQYQTRSETWKYKYVLVRDPLPPGTVDKWVQDLVDKDGNVIKYAYTNEFIDTSIKGIKISVNWGDGSSYYSNIMMSATGVWDDGEFIYDISHSLYIPQ